MAWVSDEILRLYRDMNASQVAILESVQAIQRDIRRLERRMDAMAKTFTEVLDEVKAAHGLTRSLVVLIGQLRQQVLDALANVTLSPENQAALDAVFDEAHQSAADAAAALNANPAPNDNAGSPGAVKTPPPSETDPVT
jgi:DNA repair ATPase RecN